MHPELDLQIEQFAGISQSQVRKALKNEACLAKFIGVSRQALNKRKKKLLEEMEISPANTITFAGKDVIKEVLLVQYFLCWKYSLTVKQSSMAIASHKVQVFLFCRELEYRLNHKK